MGGRGPLAVLPGRKDGGGCEGDLEGGWLVRGLVKGVEKRQESG